jgi:hypothetical protein
MNQRTVNQVELNYEVFREKLPELLPAHGGEFALMRDGGVVDFFNTAMDAYLAGKEAFGLGGFSIQEVVDRVLDLGYFSHALPQ